MENIFVHLQWKKRPGYILGSITDPCDVGRVKKNFAKKAILWLLSKASHSAWEIGDHFAISPELVQYLIEELVSENMVAEIEDSGRYQAIKE